MARTPKNIKSITTIYTLSDPYTGEIKYIGKTVKSLKTRLTGHISDSKRTRNHRCNWIQAILNSGKKPLIEVLDFCSWDESQELETYWILQFKSWGYNLVNATEGGEGNLGLKLSKRLVEEIRLRSSKTLYQYDLQGNYIQSFVSGQMAANFLGIKSNSKICACARGDRKSCKGFQWSYIKKDNIGEIKKSKQKNKKKTMEHRNKTIKNLKGYGQYFN